MRRETDIHRSSVSQIICKDLHLKCFKRHRAQELTGEPSVGVVKRKRVAKYSDFGPIAGYILESVQDRR